MRCGLWIQGRCSLLSTLITLNSKFMKKIIKNLIYLGTNLVSALTSLNMNNFSHDSSRILLNKTLNTFQISELQQQLSPNGCRSRLTVATSRVFKFGPITALPRAADQPQRGILTVTFSFYPV